MDKLHYQEMVSNLEGLLVEKQIQNKRVFLFGHCNATEELADLLYEKDICIRAILDNNVEKQGKCYRDITILEPSEVLKEEQKDSIVLVVARAYASMVRQLNELGYHGEVRKLVDYNSFSEYSLSSDTVFRMRKRLDGGLEKLDQLKEKLGEVFKIFCPFSALGDIYIMMSYLPFFLEREHISECIVLVVGNACAKVVRLFGNYDVEILSQQDMDELIQAVLYTKDWNSFIAHQDRPYVVNLHRALYLKRIPLEMMYCCGVFGLPINTVPREATVFTEYEGLSEIPRNKSVILSPYAKSVTALPEQIWKEIVSDYTKKGFRCFTNVVGDEAPLDDTLPISPMISEMKSVVEWAGTFVGIRSGLCDVIRTVKAEKIALYPEYNYSDTKWRAIDIYSLAGWKNIVVKDELQWKTD